MRGAHPGLNLINAYARATQTAVALKLALIDHEADPNRYRLTVEFVQRDNKWGYWLRVRYRHKDETIVDFWDEACSNLKGDHVLATLLLLYKS